MLQVQGEVTQLIEAIKRTEIYQEFQHQKQKLSEYPELRAQIDAYRDRNFELQTRCQETALYDEIEKFQREYETFREIPLVHDFLASELAFCRLVQDVNAQILEAMSEDFE